MRELIYFVGCNRGTKATLIWEENSNCTHDGKDGWSEEKEAGTGTNIVLGLLQNYPLFLFIYL